MKNKRKKINADTVFMSAYLGASVMIYLAASNWAFGGNMWAAIDSSFTTLFVWALVLILLF